MATTTGSRYDHIAIQDGSNTTLHYLTDNRYPDVPNDSTKYLRGDGTWNTINVSSPYVAGTGTGSAVLDENNNIASGDGAVAEGSYTNAIGVYSHSEGYYTKARGQYQHASGKYNSEDLNNTYAEIVGIGSSTSNRKNGRTLDWSGNEQLAGSLTLGLGTTNQTTVTAAQLKQLLNSLPVLVTISNNKITSHTWQQLHDAYFASRLVLQLDEYSTVHGIMSDCDGSSNYYYVSFVSFDGSSGAKTYSTTSANGYPQYAEPA